MRFLFIALLFAAVTPATSQSLKPEDVKKADSILNTLITQHRIADAEKVYHNAFVLTTSSGKMKTKSTILDEIENPDLSFQINLTENVAVILEGNTAILTGTLHQKGSYKGKGFDNYLLVTDTWIYQNGRWIIIAGHATLIPQS